VTVHVTICGYKQISVYAVNAEGSTVWSKDDIDVQVMPEDCPFTNCGIPSCECTEKTVTTSPAFEAFIYLVDHDVDECQLTAKNVDTGETLNAWIGLVSVNPPLVKISYNKGEASIKYSDPYKEYLEDYYEIINIEIIDGHN